MALDITNLKSHIYWQYGFMFLLACAGIATYKELRSEDDCLVGKIAANEMSLRVQLAEIQTKLIGIETTLSELKCDLRQSRKEKQ